MRIHLLAGAFLMGLLFGSCSQDYDDGPVKSQIEDNSARLTKLENAVNSLNNDIKSLKELILVLKQNIYISEVKQINEKWLVTFTDGSTLLLQCGADGRNGSNGKDGADGKDGVDGQDGADGKNGTDAPYLGVKQFEGIYYWTITVDGETTWLLDAFGNKIRVTGSDGKNGLNGVSGRPGDDGKDGKDGEDGKDGKNGATPLLRVDAYGYWEVSYNNGISYTPLLDKNGNKIYALGTSGDSVESFFSDIIVNEESVSFVLANGTEVVIPKLQDFYLNLTESKDILISTSTPVQIQFFVTGANSETFVECCAHGKLKAKVEYNKGASSGYVQVIATGNVSDDDKVVLFLCNAETTITYVLTFYGQNYQWTIPDDPTDPVPDSGTGEDVNIPQPGSTVVTDGDRNILQLTLTGLSKSDGTWIDLLGTGDPRQNIWVAIDGRSKGFIVEDVATGQTKAKADLVFLVDNSGTMSEEADVIANDIDSWAKELASKNLDIKFGIVGYDGCIHGAMNLTTASTLSAYLNRSGVKGTDRTKGYAGSDAASLESASYAYPRNCQTECDGAALRYADALFSFRNGANRIYVNFTDEPNQPQGNPEYSVEYVRDQYNWPMGRGTIHTVFSENKSKCTPEYPWLFSEYTGGTTIFTNSSFTGVNLNTLPVSGALTHTVILRMVLPASMLTGTHSITIVVKDPSGTYFQSKTFNNVRFTRG